MIIFTEKFIISRAVISNKDIEFLSTKSPARIRPCVIRLGTIHIKNTLVTPTTVLVMAVSVFILSLSLLCDVISIRHLLVS